MYPNLRTRSSRWTSCSRMPSFPAPVMLAIFFASPLISCGDSIPAEAESGSPVRLPPLGCCLRCVGITAKGLAAVQERLLRCVVHMRDFAFLHSVIIEGEDDFFRGPPFPHAHRIPKGNNAGVEIILLGLCREGNRHRHGENTSEQKREERCYEALRTRTTNGHNVRNGNERRNRKETVVVRLRTCVHCSRRSRGTPDKYR